MEILLFYYDVNKTRDMKKIKVSELPESKSFVGLFTMGVDGGNRSVKVSLEWVHDELNRTANEALDLMKAAKEVKQGEKGEKGEDGRMKIVMHNADEHTFVLTPDALHVWPEVTQLHLTFAAAEDGYVGEYAFQFTCPDDAGTTLELPAGIKWYGGKVVVPEAGKTYQASVVNDVIIMGGAE